MWLEGLFQGIIELAQSERGSRPVRIACTVLLSLVFLLAIFILFLLVFVIEDQSPLRRTAFLLMGIAILAYYLQFLRTILRKVKRQDEQEGPDRSS